MDLHWAMSSCGRIAPATPWRKRSCVASNPCKAHIGMTGAHLEDPICAPAVATRQLRDLPVKLPANSGHLTLYRDFFRPLIAPLRPSYSAPNGHPGPGRSLLPVGMRREGRIGAAEFPVDPAIPAPHPLAHRGRRGRLPCADGVGGRLPERLPRSVHLRPQALV